MTLATGTGPRTTNSRTDRIKGDRKNGDRNKEGPGTRKGAKTRDIRYIKEEDISDKDREKKQNQAKANGGIKGDINDTGDKDGEERQNQATRSNNRCRGPVITNKEENPGKKGNQAKNKVTAVLPSRNQTKKSQNLTFIRPYFYQKSDQKRTQTRYFEIKIRLF